MCQQLKKRFVLLDQMRGLAVLLMIIFHFVYDLNIFGLINVSFSKDLFWWVFPRVIVTLFLLSMGISLSLVHSPKIKWQKFFKRFGLIGVYAILISLATYVIFPKNWIYFGTLHCIFFSGIFSLALLPYPKICLGLGSLLVIPSAIFKINLPFFKMSHQSMDYIALFPWIGVVFIGIFLRSINFHQYNLPKVFHFKILSFFGKHALFIYMIHQILIYGFVFLLAKLIHPQ